MGCELETMALTLLATPDPSSSRDDFTCEELATVELGKFVRHTDQIPRCPRSDDSNHIDRKRDLAPLE